MRKRERERERERNNHMQKTRRVREPFLPDFFTMHDGQDSKPRKQLGAEYKMLNTDREVLGHSDTLTDQREMLFSTVHKINQTTKSRRYEVAIPSTVLIAQDG